MRQFRFIAIALITSLAVINTAFLRKTIAVLLCGFISFNSTSCYSFLGKDGKADAAVLPGSSVVVSRDASSTKKTEQKVAFCLFGTCVDIPKIPILTPNAPSGNQPNPTVSTPQPTDGDQEESTASDNEKPIADLTGTWIVKADPFTFGQNGCTAGYAGQLSVDDQDADRGFEINVTQKNNELIIPSQKVSYSGSSSGSYTEELQGTNSGNRFKVTISATSGGRLVVVSTGTVSADGNTITGETFCKFSAGSATAKGTFTWTRKQKKGVTVYIWDAEYLKGNAGHASMELHDFSMKLHDPRNTYISFWPLNKSRTYAQDVGDPEAEGRNPDHTISIPCLDEKKIKAWWTNFKDIRKSWTFWFPINTWVTKNCAGAVSVAMNIGGGEDLSLWNHPLDATLLPTRPQTILERAEQLRDKCQ